MTPTDINSIVNVLLECDNSYFNDDESTLTDDQYDKLKTLLKQTDPSNPYLIGVGSAVRGISVPLPTTMGSLNQVYDEDVANWVAVNGRDHQFVCMDKLDGASNLLVYTSTGNLQIAYSRGDGYEGADITRHISNVSSVPSQIPQLPRGVMVRGETLISHENFKKLLAHPKCPRQYKNPRNAISGLMNSSEIELDLYQFIDIVVYEIIGASIDKNAQLELLTSWGFNVVNYTTEVGSLLTPLYLQREVTNRKLSSRYDLDGIVLELSPTQYRINTSSSINPSYAAKYKVNSSDNTTTTTVTDVIWDVSKDGYLKPRIQVSPVTLVGVTITYATGFNAKFIKDNAIGKGSIVEIQRSGDVIPYVAQVLSPSPFGPILPDVDAYWSPTNVDLIVTDLSGNSRAQLQRLVDFFSSMDVPHLGEGHLQQMYDMGFTSPEQIIVLSQEDVASLVDSRLIGAKIYNGLRSKFTNVLPYQLMGSHSSIGRGVGVRKMKKLYEAFSGDMSKCANISDIIEVPGFDVKTATKIASGYPLYLKFVESISSVITFSSYQPPAVGTLTNCNIVVTGFRNKIIEQEIVQQGGKLSTSVSNSTFCVITNDVTGNSTKLTQARTRNVPIYDIATFQSKFLY